MNPQAQTVQSPSWPVGKIVLVALFTLAIGAFFYFDLKQYFSLEVLKANRNRLLAYTAANSVESVLVFIALYCLQTAFSMPGAWAFTLAAGFLFGSVLGTLYAILAATAGATLAFLASRYLLHDWVERKFGNRLGPLQEGFARNAFNYLMTLRFIPIFPFFLINLVAGVTRIRLGTYVLATAIGIIPGTFVYANAGRQLGTINSLGEIVSVRVLGAFFLLALLAVVPVLYKKFARKQA